MYASTPVTPDQHAGGDCCPFSDRLSAFYDGELEPASAAQFEAHLAGCVSCREELEEIGELSVWADRTWADGMPASGLLRVHRAIDAEDRYAIIRIASVLTGLAASVLVIGAVWLQEIPKNRQTPAGSIVILPDSQSGPDWTRVAVDLRVDPLPRTSLNVSDQPMYADARLAQWMVDGLNARGK